MKTLKDFLNDLGLRESGGNYKSLNKYGYAGKYQMGEAAMVDAGYYIKPSRVYNNDWSGKFLGKDGVFSIEDFLNNPTAQEKAQIIFKKKQWGYLKAVGADRYCGQIINGCRISPSGLLAGAHLKGAGCVAEYLRSGGKTISKDAFGTTIESYMKNFSDYDVTEIIN